MADSVQSKESTGNRPDTVDPDEVARFSALADEWWDPAGAFAPLHRLNPVRLAFIRDGLVAHFGRDATGRRALEGLALLDVGCGGGLLSEPLCRLGARVTAIDASERNIGVARAHAERMGLAIDYRCCVVEDLPAEDAGFDAVLSLEVVEHVADVARFLAACCALTRPGGALVLATLNRTSKSFLFGIVGAEYVLRWLPRGTHRWSRFVRPSELAAGLRTGGARVTDLAGIGYDPLSGDWRRSGDVSVNYMAMAVKDG